MNENFDFDKSDYITQRVIKNETGADISLKDEADKLIGKFTAWIFTHPKIFKLIIVFVLSEAIFGVVQTIKFIF